MSLFTICNECGEQFRKYSIKSIERMCHKCKNWKRENKAAKKRGEIKQTIPQVIKEGQNMIERAKEFEVFVEKMNEDYISSLIDEKLNQIVDEKFEKIRSLVTVLNNRIIELTKRVDELEE
jgi:ssDNA-binding Zn-finger/Zn-ribbon topoisomerase 1